jgi:hypothetical protein
MLTSTFLKRRLKIIIVKKTLIQNHKVFGDNVDDEVI